ncbi:PilZ domain-containing protein [Desulfomicrobium norvegicum]|uniref:PilZ domain-containing protein n=2 Tax=Desulfomicrobium TaxID=898 RepID=A0A8G2BZR0_DESNO|nr:PilZ domain-containing protein [Desulfomicrobium norvegicum]
MMSIFKNSGTRKNTKISFRTDDETLDQLKAICRIENRTISSLIESILTEYVLIHENNSLAEQEKRLSPRKKCSIPAVILADKNNKKSYFNCLIKSLSANSAQLVLKKIPDEENFYSNFFILFKLPKNDHPLLVSSQLIRSKCLENECMIVAKINCDSDADSEMLQKYLLKIEFKDNNDKK